MVVGCFLGNSIVNCLSNVLKFEPQLAALVHPFVSADVRVQSSREWYSMTLWNKEQTGWGLISPVLCYMAGLCKSMLHLPLMPLQEADT